MWWFTAILHSDNNFFKCTDVPRSTTMEVDYTGIRHPAVFRMVTLFLSQVTMKEIQKGSKPALIRWQNHASEFKIAFMDEMKWYARQQYPYNELLGKDQSLMTWCVTNVWLFRHFFVTLSLFLCLSSVYFLFTLSLPLFIRTLERSGLHPFHMFIIISHVTDLLSHAYDISHVNRYHMPTFYHMLLYLLKL